MAHDESLAFFAEEVSDLAPASAPDWLGPWFTTALRKPEPDMFSIEAMRDWLATMPREGKYSWLDCQGECLFGQFYAASGLPWYEGGATRYARDISGADVFIGSRCPVSRGARRDGEGGAMSEFRFTPAELAECFGYLDTLRKSGVTNMFGATPYLANAQGISRTRAHEILYMWMKIPITDGDALTRATKALDSP